MTFNPTEHLIKLKNKDYLETKWRIAWFRDEHPQGQLLTEIVSVEPILIMKAFVQDSEGRVLATGHGTAQAKAGAVWAGREIEKAETAAIGRALGNAGYGTQFTSEDEGENLVDSPVERPVQRSPATQPAAKTLGSGDQGRRMPTGAENAANSENGRSGAKWAYDIQALMKHLDVQRTIPQSQHRWNTIELLKANGVFDDVPDLNIAAYRVNAYSAFRTQGMEQEQAIAAVMETETF